MKNKPTYGAPVIGCHLDQSYCNACEHDGRTIRLAMHYGFEPDAEILKLLERLDEDTLGEDDAQMLSECADEVIDWLNSQETRPFLYWANNGEADAFGLWPNVEGAKEDVGFVSHSARNHTDECDPEDSERPCANYRGEWLHVNDHGNCTLYVREDSKNSDGYKDSEIWGVV